MYELNLFGYGIPLIPENEYFLIIINFIVMIWLSSIERDIVLELFWIMSILNVIISIVFLIIIGIDKLFAKKIEKM